MNLIAAIRQQCAATDVEITPVTNNKFGHYQCNSAMKLAKTLGKPPRVIAEQIRTEVLAQQDLTAPMFANIEIAGPGFINFTLSSSYLSTCLNEQLRDERHGCNQVSGAPKVAIDFSSPNIAKEMHVGHLRSTIIGDCIARVLEFLGYDVLRLNHIGDWGTQFGMLIAYLTQQKLTLVQIQQLDISELLTAYRNSKTQFDADAEFKQRAQLAVVALQQGDQNAQQTWQAICTCSRKAFAQVYTLLDIKIIERGESFYNAFLPGIISDLANKNLLQISDGAKCVYLEGFTNREGDPLPLIVQKTDGGYNYATTDLAALKHKIEVEHANWLIYVTDAGQSQHFSMVFAACRLAGYYNPEKIRIDHVPFGLVLRADGKKFQTRAGDTERLIDLIQNAIDKAEDILTSRNYADVTPEQLQQMAHVLGINAIKYADLANHRTSDYVFNINRMLQFEGNTAAFVAYAYVRIQSIKRKVDLDVAQLQTTTQIELSAPEEIDLGLHVLRFNEVLDNFTVDLLPNRLTEYLFHLAEKFHTFFHSCRVEGVPEQNSRLLLCEAVGRVLAQGLGLLGLQKLERM